MHDEFIPDIRDLFAVPSSCNGKCPQMLTNGSTIPPLILATSAATPVPRHPSPPKTPFQLIQGLPSCSSSEKRDTGPLGFSSSEGNPGRPDSLTSISPKLAKTIDLTNPDPIRHESIHRLPGLDQLSPSSKGKGPNPSGSSPGMVNSGLSGSLPETDVEVLHVKPPTESPCSKTVERPELWWAKWKSNSCSLDCVLLVAFVVYHRVPVCPDMLSTAGKWFLSNFFGKHRTLKAVRTTTATRARDNVRKLLASEKTPIVIEKNTAIAALLPRFLPDMCLKFTLRIHYMCGKCKTDWTRRRELKVLDLVQACDSVQHSLDMIVLPLSLYLISRTTGSTTLRRG